MNVIDLKADLPRDKYHIYREANPKPVFISAKYELLQAEKDALSALSTHDSDEFSEIIVSKVFKNKEKSAINVQEQEGSAKHRKKHSTFDGRRVCRLF